MTTSLPEQVLYGTAVMQIILGVADSGDPDALPDQEYPAGSATFTPNVDSVPVVTGDTPQPVMLPQPVTVFFAQGRLVTPGVPPFEGVQLIAPTAPPGDPDWWNWRVTFDFAKVALKGFSFDVEPGQVVDLGRKMPKATLSGIPTAAGPSNVLTVGTVTSGPVGSPAVVTITGVSPAQVINFTIPASPPLDGSGPGSQGPQGPAGPAGADGKSAYTIARDGGYGGTQTQWLVSLKGEDGAASTIPGPAGADSTVPGPTGPSGPKGDPGDSGTGGGSVTAADITDASTLGRSLITGVTAVGAREALGAGVSNLSLGSTSATAKSGDWKPTWPTDVNSAPTIPTSASDVGAVSTLGGSTVSLPDSNTSFARVNVPADGTPTAGWPDRFSFYYNGSRAGYFNEYGELRARPGKVNTVPFRVMEFLGGSNATVNLLEVASDTSSQTQALYFGVSKTAASLGVPLTSTFPISAPNLITKDEVYTNPSQSVVGKTWHLDYGMVNSNPDIEQVFVRQAAGPGTPTYRASWRNEWGALRGTSPYSGYGDALVRAVRADDDKVGTGPSALVSNAVEIADRRTGVTNGGVIWGRSWVDGHLTRNGIAMADTIVLGTSDPVPAGLPAGTVIVRKSA